MHRHDPAAKLLYASRIALLFVLFLLMVSGCAPRKPVTGGSPTTAACPVPQDSASRDETVAELSIPPADDGIPLTPAEIAALSTVGELDKTLSSEDHRDVVLQFKYFTHRGRPTMVSFIKRASYYLPYVRKVLRDRGMPEELAYLAIVESGYNPNAVSTSGAAGVWQFMPFTGKKYGLDYDWWIDERRDPYKATHSAATYLAKLHGDFNNWPLAIAAYNAGEGKIARALEGTGAGNFFDLKRKNHMLDDKAQLKDETKQYVPRFIAICKIMRNLDKLGFPAVDESCAPQMASMHVKPGTDLMALAQSMNMSWSEFSRHNPAFRRYVSPPDQSSTIYVPALYEQQAQAFLARPQARSFAGWRPYTVQKGDTLERISRVTGVPASVLLRVNKGITKMRPGETVMIPAGSEQALAASSVPAAVTAGTSAGPAKVREIATRRATYVVKQGDTMYSIAKSQGVDVATLQKANGLSGPTISVGQKLYIPDYGPEATAAAREEAQAVNRAIVARAEQSRTGGRVVEPTRATHAESADQLASKITGKPMQGTVTATPYTGEKSKPVQGAAATGAGSEKASGATPAASKGAAVAAGGSKLPAAAAGATSPAVAPKSVAMATGGKTITYKVQQGDTVWAIARKFNVHPKELLKMNNLEMGATLKPGDSVKVAAE